MIGRSDGARIRLRRRQAPSRSSQPDPTPCSAPLHGAGAGAPWSTALLQTIWPPVSRQGGGEGQQYREAVAGRRRRSRRPRAKERAKKGGSRRGGHQPPIGASIPGLSRLRSVGKEQGRSGGAGKTRGTGVRGGVRCADCSYVQQPEASRAAYTGDGRPSTRLPDGPQSAAANRRSRLAPSHWRDGGHTRGGMAFSRQRYWVSVPIVYARRSSAGSAEDQLPWSCGLD